MPLCQRTLHAFRPLLLTIPLALTATGHTAAIDRQNFDRAGVSVLTVGTPTRDFSPTPAPRCYEASVENRGLLWLEATVSATSAVEPRLIFLGSAAHRNTGFAVLSRTAASLWIEVLEAGTYTLCVAAQDPQRHLGDYVLHSVLVDPAEITSREGDPTVDEPDPDPTPSGTCSSSREGDPTVDEPDPDPTPTATCPSSREGDPTVDEPDPDPRSVPSLGLAASLRRQLCRQAGADDHGDTVFCATRVAFGRETLGEIANDWGDDADVFVWTLSQHRTVRIEARGTALAGALYTAGGYRIAVDDGGGAGDGFRMVKTLGPGTYVLRAEGRDRSEGPYRLSIEALDCRSSVRSPPASAGGHTERSRAPHARLRFS